MKRSFFLLFCIIVSGILIISCSKEYSLENISNVNNQALGVLPVDSLGLCSKAYVNGTYYVGAALDNSNYALVSVNVVSVGKYKIMTNVINGFYYKDSGYFNQLGLQQIELKGYGTPIIPDTTQFTFSFGTTVCSFNVNNIIDTTLGPKNAYFKLLGSPSGCTNIQVSGKYKSNIALDTSNYIVAQVNAITTGAYNISTNIINGYSFLSTGYFTQKGVQTLKIYATGTPQKTGYNNFSLIGSTGNCSFSTVVQ